MMKSTYLTLGGTSGPAFRRLQSKETYPLEEMITNTVTMGRVQCLYLEVSFKVPELVTSMNSNMTLQLRV